MKKEPNVLPPWWLYVLLGFGIFLGGAIGAVASGLVLFGLWYVWAKSKSSFPKKSALSLLIIVGGIVFYVVVFSLIFGPITYFQEDQVKNITVKNQNYGFEITYPSTWRKESTQIKNNILYLTSNDRLSAITIRRYDNEGITQEESDHILSDPEYLLEMENEPAISGISASSIMINQQPHTAVVYFEDLNKIKYKTLSTILVISPKTKLGVNYGSADERSFEKNFNDASNIIDSIAFN